MAAQTVNRAIQGIYDHLWRNAGIDGLVSIRNQKFQLSLGVIEVAAVALVNYGLTIEDAILITPIACALSIVTITLAVIFLKDKISKLQGFGIFAAIVGIIVTAF